MIVLKDLLPSAVELSLLDSAIMRSIWLDSSKSPPWGAVFLEGDGDDLLVLEWDYADVQFKFEIYCLCIERRRRRDQGALTVVASVRKEGPILYLVRTAWLRPAASGEVPNGYEPIIEEGGRLADVPSSAVVGGFVLRGMAFTNSLGDVTGVIGVDDEGGYRLRWIVEPSSMEDFLHTCDSYDLAGLLAWREENARRTSVCQGTAP